jgi:amino acid permease
VLEQVYTQDYFIVLVIALSLVPPILVSKMEKLKFMALAGVVGIVLFMTALVALYVAAVADDDPINNPVGGMRMFPEHWLHAAATVPNVLLALSYQMNFFPIFKGMANANDGKMVKAVTVGLVFCLLSYLLVGILAYDYVGNGITANFLESLSYNKVSIFFFVAINLSFLLSLYFAFPIMFFGGRNNFIALLKLFLVKEEGRQRARMADEVEEISTYLALDQSLEVRRRKARRLFVAYTLAIYLVTMGVAMGVDDIELVFNAVGAICSTSIALLLPCYFYWRQIVQRGQPRGLKFYLAIAMFAVMAPYAIFSIVALHID